MRILKFVLSHSIFISLCAVALCLQTFILLHLQPDWLICTFVFSSTLTSYNLYWLLSKYSFGYLGSLKTFLKVNLNYIVLFVAGGAVMLGCLFYIPFILNYVIAAVVLTVMYTLPLWPFNWAIQLRKTGFLKPIVLAFTWTFVTILLPASLTLHVDWMPGLLLFVARFFFMLLLCLIFDKRDIKVDRILGLHSISTDISESSLKKLIWFVFLLYMVAGILLRYYFKDNAQLVAFAFTGVAVWWVYRLSFKPQGYLFYYLLVDGLMLYSAAATLIALIF